MEEGKARRERRGGWSGRGREKGKEKGEPGAYMPMSVAATATVSVSVWYLPHSKLGHTNPILDDDDDAHMHGWWVERQVACR